MSVVQGSLAIDGAGVVLDADVVVQEAEGRFRMYSFAALQ